MDVDRFWELLEACSAHGELDLRKLLATLSSSSSAEVWSFSSILEARIAELQTGPVLRALDIGLRNAMGSSVSDDAVLYTCSWIVARGRVYFDAIRRDPEGLESESLGECEELLYVAEEALDSHVGDSDAGAEHGLPALVLEGVVDERKYPTPKRTRLREFAESSFAWIQPMVQDSTKEPIAIVETPVATFRQYPCHDDFGDAFEAAASTFQRQLSDAVDVETIPDYHIVIIVRAGWQEGVPRVELVGSSMDYRELRPGIVVDIPQAQLQNQSRFSLERYAHVLIRDCLEVYFAGFEKELKSLSGVT